MCIAADIFAQKFGYQRAEGYTGVTNEQKSTIPFDKHVYFPTNWRNNQTEPHKAKYPVFIRYGGLVSVPPEYFQRNYLGIYPITQQPLVEDPKPYETPRFA